MNAPDLEALREARAREVADFTPYEKMRLSLTARIAAGICANPEVFVTASWEGEAARTAMRVADKILMLHITGGC